MASRKPPARTSNTRQQPPARTSDTRQQQPPARTSNTRQQRPSAGGARVAPKSRSSSNQAAPAARSATPSQQLAPAATGPLGRLIAPFRSMGWLPLATLVLSLYGLGASIYLTIAHYDTSIRLACTDNGLVNCQAVTTSSQSVVFGIFPVAVLGLAFFVFMVVVNSPWGWRLSRSQPAVRWARLGSVVVGMSFVIYLIYAELIQINAICLWCTSVHAATFLIFVLVVFHTTFAGSSAAPSARR
jgi:uncharacterized membrane protein